MPKKLLAILAIVIICTGVFGQNDTSRFVIIPHVSPSLKLTENNGQWDDKILFRAQLDGGALFIEKNCLTFNFYDKKKYRALHHGGLENGKYKDLDIKSHAYKIIFEGANIVAPIEKLQMGSDYENFFIGNDETKWKGYVKNYHQAWLRNLYEGIDYEIITAINGIKYNFHVKANANVNDIALKYVGIDKIKIKDGTLILNLSVNEVIEQKPYAYQLINGKVRQVACNYKLKSNVLSFEFPNGYNKNHELVIDPLLVFAAQSGSTADNFGMTATYDPQGNLYAGGTIFGIGYPTTTGAYSSTFFGPTYYGNSDIVITKYNSTGTLLLYSTYMGGGYTETINSLIVDQNDNLCFFGVTSSTDFPVSQNAFDNSYNGGTLLMYYNNAQRYVNGTDLYVAKLNSTGSALLGCTYLGGSANDGINQSNTYSYFAVFAVPPATGTVAIAQPNYDSLQFNYGDQCRGEIQLDIAGNIYITSSTRSANFPTVNGFDNSLGGPQDGIVAKFNSALSTLISCSFIGGSSTDAGYGLIVKKNLEIYVTGGTSSNNMPYMSGGYQSTYQGGTADGYVLRISPTGTTVLGGTYFGTTSYDQSYFIQTDKYDDIYIYGQSLGNMPVLAAPNATSVFNVAGTHQFISRFNKTLSALNMSTVFGNFTNQTDISPSAFSVDKCNTIYISGWGGSVFSSTNLLANMPLLAPNQSVTDGHDFYFMALDSNAAHLLYGSYFGGGQNDEHVDGGTSRFDPQGKIYQSVCAGCGGTDDFPVTPGSWPNTPGNPNHSSNCNNGVIKLDFQILLTISSISTNTLSGCAPVTFTYTNAYPPLGPLATYTWNLGNGTTTSSNLNPTVTYTAPGTYTIWLASFNNTSCNKRDTMFTYITVYPTPTVNFSFSTTPCTNTIVTSNSSIGNFGPNPYTWNFGNAVTSSLTAPSYTYLTNGIFNLSLTARDVNGCASTLSKPVTIFNFSPGVVSSSSICNGSSTQISASGGTSYTWTPPGSLNNNSSAGPTANPTVTTIYSVNILNNSAGFPCARTLTTQILVNPTPTANFSYSANPCGGGVYFFDLSKVSVTSWNWRLSPSISSLVQNPYNFYYSGGNFNVRLLVTNAYGCKDSLVKPINVVVPPPLSITAATMVCKGGSVRLSATGGTAFAWTPTVTLDYPYIANPFASPQVSTDYSVVVTGNIFANGLPCTYLLVTSVTVAQLSAIPASAQANPNAVITGNSTTLTYIGDPGLTVTWYPTGSTTPATGYIVSASPDKPTTYTAVATKGACRQDVEVYVEAYTEGCIDKDVFVPNTFTPNNDNQNDIFLVRGLKIEEMHFAVYNRWGEMVFETTDKNKGWDGIYKGKPADVGVFGWYLKVKCFNGEETFKKGNVTLVR